MVENDLPGCRFAAGKHRCLLDGLGGTVGDFYISCSGSLMHGGQYQRGYDSVF
jgi:hypothetical protein